MSKKLILAAIATLAFAAAAQAQNLQVFYDFGKDRQYITTTFEMFKGDKFGDTFWFIDHNYNPFKNNAEVVTLGPGHIEYDGLLTGTGFNMGTWCFGLKYFFHSQDFSKTFTIYAMYEKFGSKSIACADVPVKFSAVWGLNDLFGLKGLTFKGFADFWGNNTAWGTWSFLTEPQLWMNLGSAFDNHLDIGGEIELSYNFVSNGFLCNPCAGVRWTF